ncbi:GNAT family N-acetyltransferase [Novosphingobium huizhouense]|uniref:GNAT family N-acetyltransferase n=1 Tax=Novosphingobium huizhouense TaxID=2866625 RepID=UPI001CD87D48|nr:GNAT family N-acetyltransferase [Novosphingobium huizhouense]
MKIELRAVEPSDLPVFFEHQCDAEAAEMVGFTSRTRVAFEKHWKRIISDPQCIVMTVESDGNVVGYVSAFPRGERQEIAYWFGREHWHKGIGKNAVAQFLQMHGQRPLFATVADTNPASSAILLRCGFTHVGEDEGPDGQREHMFRLG